MRKLIYYIACTADGFIARSDGSFDFFPLEGEHLSDLLAEFPETIPAHLRAQFNIDSENKHFDTVLMGRSTYEVGSKIGFTNPYPQMKQYLFSSRFDQSPDPAVELVSEDALTKVGELKREPGKDIWLCGGSELATQLFPAIDELILKVNPVVIGNGIPLFRRDLKTTELELVHNKLYQNGFNRMHYRLKH